MYSNHKIRPMPTVAGSTPASPFLDIHLPIKQPNRHSKEGVLACLWAPSSNAHSFFCDAFAISRRHCSPWTKKPWTFWASWGGAVHSSHWSALSDWIMIRHKDPGTCSQDDNLHHFQDRPEGSVQFFASYISPQMSFSFPLLFFWVTRQCCYIASISASFSKSFVPIARITDGYEIPVELYETLGSPHMHF